MPLIASTYKPKFLFKNSHFNTVFKTLFYNGKVFYERKRIATPDNDYIDIDFSTANSDTLLIVLHGLEGSSNSKYIISVVNALNSKIIDCAAINFRGCSGTDNNKIYSYHSGKINDLELIVTHILENYNYTNIVLLGYSMGGNVGLKFMGTSNLAVSVKGAIAVSVPCDLEGSSKILERWYNKIYLNRFMKSLKEKAILKANKFPNEILNKDTIKSTTTFEEFDNVVTAPLFGFKNAKDYWNKNSCKQFIKNIYRPTLLINALDDSFLSSSCYPFSMATKNTNFYLETPKYGGHVGFNTFSSNGMGNWIDKRVFEFIQYIIS